MKNKIYTWIWVNYTHNQFTFQRLILWLIAIGFAAHMQTIESGLSLIIWTLLWFYGVYGYFKECNNLENI